MPVNRFHDLRQNKAVKHYIIRCCLEELSVQERTLAGTTSIEANIEAFLNILDERDDVVFVAQTDTLEIIGYALLTEHKNTWTGLKEGFIYALKIEAESLNTLLAHEVLEAVRAWAVEKDYQLVRVEVREGISFQSLIEKLHSLGWTTSTLIPCKLLSASDQLQDENAAVLSERNIRIRAFKKEDYSFVVNLLAEATWAGLSKLEQSLLTFERLVNNIREDYEPAFSEGTSFGFVAESTTEGLCAHITASRGDRHPWLDISEVELVDVFVLPPFSGLGLGTQLTRYILSTCLEKGYCLVRSTVVAENAQLPNIQQICMGLERAGWWINTRIMYMYIPHT